jgi:hypothetical protein
MPAGQGKLRFVARDAPEIAGEEVCERMIENGA